jgi:hypothetical protein
VPLATLEESIGTDPSENHRSPPLLWLGTTFSPSDPDCRRLPRGQPVNCNYHIVKKTPSSPSRILRTKEIAVGFGPMWATNAAIWH